MKKFFAYTFITLTLIGLFSFGNTVTAQNTNLPTCTFPSPTNDTPTNGPAGTGCRLPTCVIAQGGTYVNGPLGTRCAAATNQGGAANQPSAGLENVTSGSAFENNIAGCAIITGDFDDCVVKIVYYIFYVIPSFLLNLIANAFNVIIALALSSAIYTADFVNQAWHVTRDVSNIFFILILIYIAVQLILGMGHGVKKMVVQVIIMALLINFSMFFTKIIIDSSNVLALVFYNKLNVNTVVRADGQVTRRAYAPMLGDGAVQDKDISGGLVSKFDVTRLLSEDFFKKVRERSNVAPTLSGAGVYVGSGAAIGSFIPVVGTGVGALIGGVTYGLSFVNAEAEVPPGIMIGIIISAGLILCYAFYAFLVASVGFLSRIIELWVLMIFAPFAFMSSALPALSHMEYIGWSSWLKRVLRLSFMAPIFMFFMYFIFIIANTGIWNSLANRTPAQQGMIETIIFLFLPAAIILALLKQATRFAKEWSGVATDALLGTVGTITGLAVGGGIGLAASGLQGTLGHLGKRVFDNKGLAEAEAKGSRFAKNLRTFAGGDDGKGGLAGSSFDARRGVVGTGLKLAGTATGLNLGAQSKVLMKESGGYVADLERRDAIRKKRAEGLKVKENEDVKQRLNLLREEAEVVKLNNSAKLHELDGQITSARQKSLDLKAVRDSYKKSAPEYEKSATEYNEAAKNLKKLRDEKSAIKNGSYDEKAKRFRTQNGQISAEVIDKTINYAAEATKKAAADPRNATLANLATMAKAGAASARATKAVTEAEEAIKSAALNPTNVSLATAAELAKKQRDLALENAKEAEKIASDLALRDKAYEKGAEFVRTISKNATRGIGYSQDNYEDNLIPHAEHNIKDTNDRRTWSYAESIENESFLGMPKFWNEGARNKSAHDIRMGVKADKHGDGHGDGGHFLEALGAEIVAGAGKAVLSGGDDHSPAGGGGSAPAAH